jgi:hypothetical protein
VQPVLGAREALQISEAAVAATAEVLGHLDDPRTPATLCWAAPTGRSAPPPPGPRQGERWRAARARAADLVRRQGWPVEPEAPALDWLADVIAALDALDQPHFIAALDDYAAVPEQLAEVDLGLVEQRGVDRPAALVEAVVVGTLLGEAMFNAIRRLAQENASARRFAG